LTTDRNAVNSDSKRSHFWGKTLMVLWRDDDGYPGDQ
jgi:hypothetical protein